jgi:hypothetical protein
VPESCSGVRVGRKILCRRHACRYRKRRYFGQAAFNFAAIDLYSSGESFLLGAGVPGGPSPK